MRLVANFCADRPTLAENNQDPENLLKLLREEIDETEAELFNGRDKLGPEMADVLWFLISLAEFYNIDLEQEIREKAARNYLKYPAVAFLGGDYYESREECQEEWRRCGGEDDFYGEFTIGSNVINKNDGDTS